MDNNAPLVTKITAGSALRLPQNTLSRMLLTIVATVAIFSLTCGQQLMWSPSAQDFPDMVAHAGRLFSLDLSTHPVYGDLRRLVQIQAVSNGHENPSLPDWLHFNDSTRVLAGLAVAPRDLGSVLLTITSSPNRRWTAGSHQHGQVSDPTNDVFMVTVVKPTWDRTSVSHRTSNSALSASGHQTSNVGHQRSNVAAMKVLQDNFRDAGDAFDGYKDVSKDHRQPSKTSFQKAREETGSKSEHSKQNGGCEEQIVASLIVCASASALSATERIGLLSRLANFLGVPVSSVTLVPSDTRGLVALTDGGYQLVSAGPGSDSTTGCSLSENAEFLWPLSCSAMRHLADFSRVLQHNVDGGRLQEELGGRKLMGWYVASSDSLATRQNRRRHRRAAGSGYRTATPTPVVQPVRPTRFSSVSAPSITSSSSVVGLTPTATLTLASTRPSTPVEQYTFSSFSGPVSQPTPPLLAPSTQTPSLGFYTAGPSLSRLASSSATPPLLPSSSPSSSSSSSSPPSPPSSSPSPPSSTPASSPSLSSSSSPASSPSPSSPSSSSILASLTKDKLTSPSNEPISEHTWDKITTYSSPEGSMPSSSILQSSSSLNIGPVSSDFDLQSSYIRSTSTAEILSEKMSRVLGSQFEPSPLSSQYFTLSRPTVLASDPESLFFSEITTTADVSSMIRSDTPEPTVLSTGTTKSVDTPFYSMSVSRSSKFSDEDAETISLVDESSMVRSVPINLPSREFTPMPAHSFSFSQVSFVPESDRILMDVSETKVPFVEIFMSRTVIPEPSVSPSESFIPAFSSLPSVSENLEATERVGFSTLGSETLTPALESSMARSVVKEPTILLSDVSTFIQQPAVTESLQFSEDYASSSELVTPQFVNSRVIIIELPSKSIEADSLETEQASAFVPMRTTISTDSSISVYPSSAYTVDIDAPTFQITPSSSKDQSPSKSLQLSSEKLLFTTGDGDTLHPISSVLISPTPIADSFVSIASSEFSISHAVSSMLDTTISPSTDSLVSVATSEFSVSHTVSSVLDTTMPRDSMHPTPVSKLSSVSPSDINKNTTALQFTESLSKQLVSPAFTQTMLLSSVPFSQTSTIKISSTESLISPLASLSVSVRILSSSIYPSMALSTPTHSNTIVRTSDLHTETPILLSSTSKPTAVDPVMSTAEAATSILVLGSASNTDISFTPSVDPTDKSSKYPDTSGLHTETPTLLPFTSKPTAPSPAIYTAEATTSISVLESAYGTDLISTPSVDPTDKSSKYPDDSRFGPTTHTDMLSPTPAVPTSQMETATPNTTFTTSTATTTTTTTATSTTTAEETTSTTSTTTRTSIEEDTTEEWWPPWDTTEDPYEHINHRPFLQRPIGLISAEQGKLLEYTIPADVFYDVQDGNTRQLSLALELPSYQDLPDNFWLYLEPRLQMLVGLPLHQDMDIQNSSIVLVARDSEGMAARHRILLQITAQPRGQLTHRFTLQFLIDFQHFMRDRRNLTYLVSRVSEYFGDGPEARYIEILGVSQGSLLLTWSNSTLTSSSICPKKAIQGLMRQMVRRDGSVRSSFNRFVGRQLRLVHIQFEYLGTCHVPPPTSPPPATTTEIVLEHIDDGVSIWAHVILPVLIAILVFFLLILVFVLCNRRRRERHRLEIADDVVEKEAISNDRNPIIFPEELDMAYTSNGGDVSSGVSFKPRDPLVLPSDCKNTAGERGGHRGSRSSCGRSDRGNWSPEDGEATRMLRNSDFCGGGSSRNSRASNSNRGSTGGTGAQPDVLDTAKSPPGPDVAAFTTAEGRFGEEGDENAMHVYPSSGGAGGGGGGDGPEDVQRRAKRKKRSGGRKRDMKDSRKKKREKDKGVSVSASSTLSWDRPEHHYLDDEEMASRSSTLNSVRSGKPSGSKAGGSGRSPPPRSPPPYWQSQGDPPPYRLPPTYITSNNITRV